MRVGFANLLLAATPRTLRIAPPLRAASCGAWLDSVYDRIDYEKALFSADMLDEGDADNDDFGEDAFIYALRPRGKGWFLWACTRCLSAHRPAHARE